MLRADIQTEVSPVVGSERQSEDLVRYLLHEFDEDTAKIWDSNIFGKSLHDLITEVGHHAVAMLKAVAEDADFGELEEYANAFESSFLTETGATVYSALKKIDLRPVRNNRYSNIYLMLGLNEVGIGPEEFTENYAKIIDYIRACQPEANIIAVSVTPVVRWVTQQPYTSYTLENINELNAALRELCAGKECWYLDIASELSDEEGYLLELYAYRGDGKHMEANGYELWADIMRTHYVDEGLLSE